MGKDIRIAITGFMGVGKSSVARHLSHVERPRRGAGCDMMIPASSDRTGGTIARFLIPIRELLMYRKGFWLILIENDGSELASFDHCWRNIAFGRKDRPLARDKTVTRRLFDERQRVYCLAEWHFIVRPDFTSYEVARKMTEEIFL